MSHALASVPSISKLAVDDYSTLLPILEQHEQLARFTKFDHNTAFELGCAIRSIFLDKYSDGSNGIAIKIDLWNDTVLFSGIVGSAGTGNFGWAQRKRNVIRMTGQSSLRVGRMMASKGKELADIAMPFPEYGGHGGAFPIWIKGVDVGPIGVIAVSGLPQLDDHQLIIDALVSVSQYLAPADK